MFTSLLSSLVICLTCGASGNSRAAFGMFDTAACTNMSLGALTTKMLFDDGGGVASSSDNKSRSSDRSGICSQGSEFAAASAMGTSAVDGPGAVLGSMFSLCNTESIDCHCAAVAFQGTNVYDI